MADQPISGLATFPASPTSATGTSADLIEFLDVNDTSMASTGTNKKINMADLFSTFVTAGAGISVTQQTSGGGVVVANTATGVTGTYGTGNLNANYTLTTSFATVGNNLTVTLPSAGTYLVVGSCYAVLNITTGSAAQYIYANTQLYNTTGSAVLAGTIQNAVFIRLGASTSGMGIQQTAPIGPFIITAAGLMKIDVQANYGTNVTTVGTVQLNYTSSSQPGSILSYIRIA